MYDRRRCLLDNEAWRTLPYSYISRTYEDDLWHLLERIPALVERYDILSASSSRTHDTCAVSADRCLRVRLISLRHDIRTLHQSLQGWYKQLKAFCGKKHFQRIPSTTALLPDGKRLISAFTECFMFVNDKVGTLLTVYWCYEMRLITIALEVQRLFTHVFIHLSGEDRLSEESPLDVTSTIFDDSEWIPMA